MPHAFRRGEFVRVDLATGALRPAARRRAELLSLALMSGFCAFASYATARFVWGGIEADELTQGMLEVPLWWPQASMVLGLAVVERGWDVWCGRVPIYTAHELNRAAQHDFSERFRAGSKSPDEPA